MSDDDYDPALDRAVGYAKFFADNQDNAHRARLLQERHGAAGQEAFAGLLQQHAAESGALIEQQARDPEKLRGPVLHSEEWRYLADQHRAELLGLHWELSGNKDKAAGFYDQAAQHEGGRHDIRVAIVEKGESDLEAFQRVRWHRSEVPLTNDQIGGATQRYADLRREHDFPAAEAEPKFVELKGVLEMDIESQRTQRYVDRYYTRYPKDWDSLNVWPQRIAETVKEDHDQAQYLGFAMRGAAIASVDASSLAERLEDVDMREAARCRYEAARAADTVNIHMDERSRVHMSTQKTLREGTDMLIGKSLEAVAQTAEALIDTIATAFESLIGGGTSPRPVQQPRAQDRGISL